VRHAHDARVAGHFDGQAGGAVALLLGELIKERPSLRPDLVDAQLELRHRAGGTGVGAPSAGRRQLHQQRLEARHDGGGASGRA
jgi:hypothetical protein